MCDEYDLPPTYMEIAMMTTSGSCGHRTLYEKRVSKGAKSRPDEKDKYKKRKPVTYGKDLINFSALYIYMYETCTK